MISSLWTPTRSISPPPPRPRRPSLSCFSLPLLLISPLFLSSLLVSSTLPSSPFPLPSLSLWIRLPLCLALSFFFPFPSSFLLPCPSYFRQPYYTIPSFVSLRCLQYHYSTPRLLPTLFPTKIFKKTIRASLYFSRSIYINIMQREGKKIVADIYR